MFANDPKRLEALTLDKSMAHYKEKLALDYAELVYNGLWFTPLREALDKFFEVASQNTTGEVTMRMYKGSLQPVSRKSPYSLYSHAIASFTMGAEYDRRDRESKSVFTSAGGQVHVLTPAEIRAWQDSYKSAPEKMMAKLEGRGFAYVRDVYAELQQARSGTRPAN